MSVLIDRRRFNKGLLASAATGAAVQAGFAPDAQAQRFSYSGRNVIIVRFGGGVRRRETIDPDHTYAPYMRHVLAKRATLFSNMRISSQDGIVTSHAQGTLYILTGRYDRYEDIEGMFLKERFEPKAPTIFEYLRKTYDIPSHQTLIVNGEDRVSEDFLTFSKDHAYGVNYRSSVLSLHWFKTYVLQQKLAGGNLSGAQLAEVQKQLKELEARNYRGAETANQVPELQQFWERWRLHYGDSGFKNPRGDRLLTELAVRAIRELKPKLMMVNYQDPDYVHWGNMSHYTRAIAIIDQGLKQLVQAVEAAEEYRGNTIFVIVPDCGRDNNPLMQVPFQHHFNSRSAHEVWAMLFGPGIAQGHVVDKNVNQAGIAATIAQIMGFTAEQAEGPVLSDALL